jgi:hypothetical protein
MLFSLAYFGDRKEEGPKRLALVGRRELVGPVSFCF